MQLCRTVPASPSIRRSASFKIFLGHVVDVQTLPSQPFQGDLWGRQISWANSGQPSELCSYLMSSMWRSTPANLIHFFKCLGALLFPKGNLLKWYLPNWVTNVFNWWESLAKGICLNPQFAPSSLNNVVPLNWDSVSSAMDVYPLSHSHSMCQNQHKYGPVPTSSGQPLPPNTRSSAPPLERWHLAIPNERATFFLNGSATFLAV